MKSTLLRLSALLLTFSVGVAIPQFFRASIQVIYHWQSRHREPEVLMLTPDAQG